MTRFIHTCFIACLATLLWVGVAVAQPTTEAGDADDKAVQTNAQSTEASQDPAIQDPVKQESTEAAAQSVGGMDGSTYAVRLRDLEQRIDELKEQIRRSHTRLSLLSDTILGGGVAGSRAGITFDNNMSGAFRLTRAVFVLDGAVQYNRSDDTGALADQKSIPIYRGSIPPGDHTLQVMLEFRGHGYGVFSYLRGYRFEIRSSHAFTVTEGKAITLKAVAYEKGGVTTPLEQRPAVRYMESFGSVESAGEAEKPAAKPSVGASISIGGK